MKIFVKRDFKIIGDYFGESELDRFVFSVPNDDGSITIMTFYPHEKKVLSECQIEISNDLFEFFQTGKYKEIEILDEKGEVNPDIDRNISDHFNAETGVLYSNLKSTDKLIDYIKNWLSHPQIEDSEPTPLLCSIDGERWWQMETSRVITAIDRIIFSNFTENNLKMIQKCLDNKIEPPIALEFLYKAMNERDSRHKWIYATIAAELAIKEFLIIKNPELEVLLNELPSPPLDKLYGKILKEYGGIEPYIKIKDIQYGVRIRNQLVHRPQDIILDSQDTYIYVRLIEATIFQLLSILYPDIAPIVADHYPPLLGYPELERPLKI
jgi:hypothetical protein